MTPVAVILRTDFFEESVYQGIGVQFFGPCLEVQDEAVPEYSWS